MIERALIVESILYLLPLFSLVGLTYYSYKTKGIYLKEFYKFLYIVPLYTVILSLKFFFTLKFVEEKILISSISDFSLFIVSAIFILPILNDLGFKLYSQINDTLLVIILPYFSLFILKSLHGVADLFAYWTISVFIILVSNWLYSKDNTLKGLFYISTIIFYLDFTIRFFAYYKNYQFYKLIEISSFIGIAALGIVLVEVFLFIEHCKPVNIPDEVKRVRLPTMRRTFLITLIISISIATFVSFASDYYDNSVVSTEKLIKEELYQTEVQLNIRSFEFFDRANALLETLASGYSLKSGNKLLIETKIREAYNTNKNLFSSLTYMNKDGIIVYTFPHEEVSGTSIRDQSHVQLLLQTHRPVISWPLKTVQGIYAVVIHQPVFEGNEFKGSVAGLIRLSSLTETLSLYARKQVGFIVTEGDIVIASSERDLIFKNFKKISKNFLKLNIVESNFFTFLNKRFFVYTYLPVSILSEAKVEIIKRVALALFVFFGLILSLFYFMLEIIRRGDEDKSRIVEEAVLKEIDERIKYRDVYTRLSKMLVFFKGISLSMPEKEFFSKFLDIAISVIPNGEKGTVAFSSEDGYLRFVAAKGYDMNKLKKLKIPFDKEKDIMKDGRVSIVKRIYKTDEKFLSTEGIQILKEIGNYGIKSTLTAPIYVNNNYIGSIFIDNFSSEDAFSEEDVKIAESISQIASLFVEGREYIRKLQYNLIVTSVVSDVVSAFGRVGEVKNPAKIALPILQEVVSSHLTLFAVYVGSLSGYVAYCATQESEDSSYLESRFNNINSKGMLSADFVKSNLLVSLPKCKEVYIKNTYVVSAKNTEFLAIFGFGSEWISGDVERVLDKLTDEFQYIFTNVELLKQLSEAHVETFISMTKAIEAKDPYTKNHSERVTAYSYLLGKKYGLNVSEMKVLFYSALLHDVGKIGVPDYILKKRGRLSPDEYEQIKKHPEFGADIVRNIKFLEDSVDIILHHHERWNGLGYPSKLKGSEIPLLSRIISIADTFDAITSDRSYRKGRSFEEALEIIFKEKGKQLDPELVQIFLSISKMDLKYVRNNPDILKIYKELI